MKKCMLVAAACFAGAVSAGEALRCGRGAQVELQSAGITIRPEGFLPGWKIVGSAADGETRGGIVPFKMDWRTAKSRGSASFVQQPGGKVSARWFMTVDGTVRIEQLFLGVKIPFDKFDGGKYGYDGKLLPFPKAGSSFHFGHGKGVRSIALVGRDGATRCELALDCPRDVFMQDSSRFGGGFELRITSPAKTLSPGDMHCFGATLSSPSGLTLMTPPPVKIVAGDDWVPMRPSAEVKAGSALDFSSICGIDAPAGRYGRVVVRNGRFEFANRPGVAQRFYGVNLCFGANYGQTRHEADVFAARLARLGYNAVRLHHHDGILVGGAEDGTKINPKSMAELDALVAALFENGIYVTTDLYVSRRVPYRQCGVDMDGSFGMMEFKDAVRTNDAATANLARFAREWLAHVNPHTGRRWADEPGIVGISLVNENCPDNERRLSPSEMEGAKAAEDRFFERMKRVVRDEIGSEIPLTDLNGWSMNPAWDSCRRKFDYVDMHFYVDHPRFLETPWRLPSSCANVNPLRGGEPHGVSGAGRCGLAGKPFTVTEWNFAAPGKFRCAGGVVTGLRMEPRHCRREDAGEEADGLFRRVRRPAAPGVGAGDDVPLSAEGPRRRRRQVARHRRQEGYSCDRHSPHMRILLGGRANARGLPRGGLRRRGDGDLGEFHRRKAARGFLSHTSYPPDGRAEHRNDIRRRHDEGPHGMGRAAAPDAKCQGEGCAFALARRVRGLCA